MFKSEEEGKHQLAREENILLRLNLDVVPPNLEPAVTDLPLPSSGETEDHDVNADLQSNCDVLGTDEESDSGAYNAESDSSQLDNSTALKLNRLISDAFRVGGSRQGRLPGVSNRTDDENASIAIITQLTGRDTAAALTGAHPRTASYLTHAQTNTEHKLTGTYNANLKNKIIERGGTVIDKAFDIIVTSMNQLTDDRIKGLKTAQIAKVARDMSGIIKDVTPREDNNSQGVHFHIWRPELGEESDYGEVINVRPVERS